MALQQLSSSQVNPEAIINENFEALDHVGVFGKAHATSTGLTWGYNGGRWGGTAITAGTVTLTNAATNYVVMLRSSGAVSVSTATTNWNNTTSYGRLYKLTTAGSVVTATEDHRAGPYSPFDGGGGGVRSTATALSISSNTVNIDCALGDYFTLALNANVTTITFSNLPPSGHGASLMIHVTQDSTPRTVAWPASFKWAGGAAGSVSTGSGVKDVLGITTFDAGTAWNATLAKAFA